MINDLEKFINSQLSGNASDTLIAYNFIDRAHVLNEVYNKREELLMAKKANSILKQYLPNNHHTYPELWNYVGQSYLRIGNLDSADFYLTRALARRLEKQDTLDLGMVYLLMNLGEYYQHSEQFHKSLQSFQRAINLNNFLSTVEDSVSGPLMFHLSEAYSLNALPDEAMEAAKKSVQLSLMDSTDKELSYCQSLYVVAKSFIEQSRYDSAKQYLSLALSIAKRKGARFWEQKASYMRDLSMVENELGNYDKAWEWSGTGFRYIPQT